MDRYVIPFGEIDNTQVSKVGGKNASLGEMFQKLSAAGIQVPDGFATTSAAYWMFIEENQLKDWIQEQLDELDQEEYSNLKEVGQHIRSKIKKARMPEGIAQAVREAYRQLNDRVKNLESVAIRSSATAEDLPSASFAGQHESFMNIQEEEDVVATVQLCYASLFTDRAIKYRDDHGFEHMKIALSAGVQKMVRSDKACAGVAFTIEPETGFDKVIFINGSWGLGDYVVGGEVIGDQFYLFKENLRKGNMAILSKDLGSKEHKLIYSEQTDERGQSTQDQTTTQQERNQFILSDSEIEKMGRWCLAIEDHYGYPMDIEWAKDGHSGELFIVQARPETVHSSGKEKGKLKQYALKEKGVVITSGTAIGEKIAAGKAKILHSPEESDKLEKGDVLITEITNPDWDPIMQKASAIVTDSGGRTSHAAIVAREMGAVAVVGAEDATQKIQDGQEVTVCCAEGQEGHIYEGILEWEEEIIDTQDLGDPDTHVELILANPKLAFRYASYPVDGVGLVRLEFAINRSIKVHPMALVEFEELENEEDKRAIEALTAAYQSKEQYFIENLSMAVGTIAASFYPREVIVRMSDFKTNEYAALLGGHQFEPKEENPMLGFRGASRYYSDAYRGGFRLECLAMKRASEEMGLDNIKLMIPFCRTVEEGKKVIREMEKYGLKQGEQGLEVYVMVEIPSNVVGCEEFAEVFDGFSIGSNDLTQLTLGVDRDSELVSDIFDERNDQVREMIATAIRKAHKSGKRIGLCGQAPSDFPEFAQFLVEQGIHSISFNPDAIVNGITNILKAEGKERTLQHMT
ncbi:MAG: phosphoenolpyruvate synthase [Bacteroidota bacterium]